MKARSIIMLCMFAVCAVILVCAAIIGCTTVPYAAKKQSSAGKAVLGISPHEKDISIKAVTADGSPVQVEGCTVKRDSEGDWEELELAGE